MKVYDPDAPWTTKSEEKSPLLRFRGALGNRKNRAKKPTLPKLPPIKEDDDADAH